MEADPAVKERIDREEWWKTSHHISLQSGSNSNYCCGAKMLRGACDTGDAAVTAALPRGVPCQRG
jgi:hypothetical protein